VALLTGITACCSIQFAGRKPEMQEIIKIWRNFSGPPQELETSFGAGAGNDLPRRKRAASTAKRTGMAETARQSRWGRLRKCNVFDYALSACI